MTNVLIIEDNEDNAIIFTAVLENVGFDVTHMDDGLKGVKYLTENTPDIIILDLNMPGMDGSQVLKWIRSNPRLAATKIMLASADARWAMDLRDDVDLVLMKPIDITQIISFTRRLAAKVA